MDNILFWKDHGRIEIGTKSENKDLCDDNGIMWLEQVVLGCPVCGGMVRDYPQNISSYDWCPRCSRRLYHKRERAIMTERERLTNLIYEAVAANDYDPKVNFTLLLVDHLLDNGVILLPVKVGDTVYIISRHNGIHRRKVVEILMAEECSFVVGGDIYSEERYHFSYIGKTVFLSREEAEAALAKTDEIRRIHEEG